MTRPTDPRARVFATALNDRCTGCMEGQGRRCACRGEAKPAHRQRYSAWSPAVNVLLILALMVAVKLKLTAAAMVLAGLLAWAAWRAWA